VEIPPSFPVKKQDIINYRYKDLDLELDRDRVAATTGAAATMGAKEDQEETLKIALLTDQEIQVLTPRPSHSSHSVFRS
jgi:hypothetical protein